MDYHEAMRLLAARLPSASREATKTIRRLAMRSPVAVQSAERVIAAGLADPQAELTAGERDELAALLSGERAGRSLELRLRVSAEEKRRIQADADAAGQTVSEYIRRRIGLA